MQDGDLRVSTTTDSAAVVSAVANADDEGGRVPAPKLDVEKLDGSTAVSWEHPRSERTLLLERLAGHEADLEALTGREADSEQVSSTESSEEGQPVDESELGIDMAAVREAATRDAIEDARRLHREAYYRELEQQHLSPQQAELQRLQGQLAATFAAKLNAIKPADVDLEKLVKDQIQEGTDVSVPVRDALLALPGGPEATIYLLQHPEERRRLASLPEHVAVASVGQLTARLNSAAKRQRSNAPAPITPVGGSATRSSVPPDELPYQEFARLRERQINARRRR